MTTDVPMGPLPGVNEVIVGGGMTVKLVALVPVPDGVVTAMVPVVAPAGTLAVSCVTRLIVMFANPTSVPLNFTDETFTKLVPVMVTVPPTGPLVGVKLATVGAAATVKLVALVAVPATVSTVIFPVVAPAGIVAVIRMRLLIVGFIAATPLNLTAFTDTNDEPEMETLWPTAPLAGVNEVMVGTPMTLKFDVLDPVPTGVVTEMAPDVAPTGTLAVILFEALTVKLATPTSVVLNLTDETLVKSDPLITTDVPVGPLVGVKEVITGKPIIVNDVALEPEPAGVVTVMTPLAAPVGTLAVSCVGELTVKFPAPASVVLNFTDDTFMKLVPVIVTVAPTAAEVGVKLTTVGAPITVKSVALVPVPATVVTEIFPVNAPEGTVALISVSLFTVIVVAEVTPNLTKVPGAEKFCPVIVTSTPIMPLAGRNEVIIGAPFAIKSLALSASPPGVTTLIFPEVADAGTTASI